jgi:hypothetical protein
MRQHRIFTLRYDARPHTLNIDRRLHWSRRAEHTREWRQAFCLLAKAERIPPLGAIEIVAIPHLRDRRSQDVAACLPSVKASIDGLVDAGVIPDDDTRFVHRLTFCRPVHDGRDCLTLIVTEVATIPIGIPA